MYKSKVLKNLKGEKTQQTFFCSREGERKDRGLRIEARKWEQKNETRYNCKARFHVHIDFHTHM